MDMETIDFVIPWVDDTDPEWRTRKRVAWNQFMGIEQPVTEQEGSNGECRYRDMGMLEYWFRSVEKFAPWVNRIFFVTCGQKPAWLNEKHPKLVLVDHKDYIPSAYLPTFNAGPIELNYHRIPELSEHFVVFNDDVLLIRPVKPEFFFVHGEPCLPANLTPCDYFGYDFWSFLCFSDYVALNDHFNLFDSIGKNRNRWFNVKKLGVKTAIKNFLSYKINRTIIIRGYEHLANAHLKSTYREVWDTCSSLLDETSRHPFRTIGQVNQWLFCAWNQATGRFHPEKPFSHGSHYNISKGNLDEICSVIREQRVPQICLNDSAANDDPEKCFADIRQALEAILPEKSQFEL